MKVTALSYNDKRLIKKILLLGSEKDFVEMCQKKG